MAEAVGDRESGAAGRESAAGEPSAAEAARGSADTAEGAAEHARGSADTAEGAAWTAKGAATGEGRAGNAESVTGPRGVIACVVDAHPRFHLEALRWFATLTRLAGVAAADLVVHAVAPARGEALDHLRAQGVTVRPIEPFDARSPHCNKIAGALRLAAERPAGRCVLTDSDVAVCEDPRRIPIPPGRVGMTPVHMANPPLAVLEQVFAAAGLPLPRRTALQLQPGELTLAGNGNGGLYVVDGPRLSAVAGAWAHWARWLLDRQEVLASWALHTDQVAMAMALAAAAIPVCDFDIRWNLPTHVPAIIPATPPVPAVVHYHRHVDAAGRLLPTGRAAIDRQIAAANAALDGLWRQSFPNATFWQWRYLTDPALGSGTGSRGQRLAEKRALLAAVIDVLQPASTLDVGCGDGAATAGLPLPGYTGLDLSPAAIERARAGRPDGRFEVGALTGDTAAAELVLCLDVLLHQAEAAAYEQLVRRLLDAAARALVVSGYERPFQPSWATVHFHEPLSATLRRAAPAAEIHLLREEGEISTFLVLRPGAAGAGAVGSVPDAGAATLAALIRRLARREERLGELEAGLAAATAEAELARQEAARLAAECRAHAATGGQMAAELERWRERVAALESTRALRLRAWLLRLRHGGKP